MVGEGVTTLREGRRLVRLACERFGKLHVLFNNAATMPVSALNELRVEDWEETIDINIKGVLYGVVQRILRVGGELVENSLT